MKHKTTAELFTEAAAMKPEPPLNTPGHEGGPAGFEALVMALVGGVPGKGSDIASSLDGISHAILAHADAMQNIAEAISEFTKHSKTDC